LHGLVPASAGRVSREPAARQAMLFQRPHMLRTTARNNIALGLWLRRMTWREAQALALGALERVGLGDIADRNAKTLSGGQQQRLALARAWALRPDMLLLDEPTASLDPHAKRDVEELMHEFAQGLGVQGGEQPMTMVFASHNLGQVKRLASRVLYLEQGRVLADLPVDQFFDGELLAAQFPAAHLFVKGEFL
jgi:tungstate transport system ATP-binding protein